NIIEIEKSFNCLLIRNTNTSLFPVAIFKDKDERFIIFGQQIINLNVLTVVLLRDDIVKGLNGSEMKPQKLFIEYFQAELDNQVKLTASNIHIITITAQKLPDQLEFPSIALREKLKEAIHDHYKFWKARQREKTKIPEYFILAGAGEGKSRTAQELPRLLIECTDSDADLQNCLKDALVFNLSFKNGTKLIWGDEIMSSKAI
ncbi:13130_t:CDS:2, partial [Funneliformis mosseae]